VARRALRLAPLLLPLVPKCPLCLLPLMAAAGAALPPGPPYVLDGLVAISAAAWLGIVLSTARWLPVRAAAVAAAALLVAGRFAGSEWASAAGAVLVLAVVVWTGFRPRACAGKACARADERAIS
jgi:hypothetical protein